MKDIDEIMYLISWDRTEEDQQKGINMARSITCLRAFFQPIGPNYDKDVWGNCALVLCERTDEELEPYVFDMLLWLEDLNWPGAELIQQRLVSFSRVEALVRTLNLLVPALEFMYRNTWLSSLASLLSNKKLTSVLSNDIVQVLTTHLV